MMKLLPRLAAALVPLALLLGACSKGGESSTPTAGATTTDGGKPLEIWWFQWAPATGLQELGDEFAAATGKKVVVNQIPLDSYQERVFQEFGARETKFDIVIGDSQWIGRGATKGLYLELTDWLPTVVDLKSIHERAAKYLCEYPSGSGRWYAAPCETDAVGLVYRKDWFEDPAEKKAFQERFGRELAVPQSWEEFRDVAQFFQRPAEKRYGCVFTTGRAYDALTMGFQNLLWSFGGAWHAEGSNQVEGHLNTPATAAAVDFFRELVHLGPNGAENLNYGEALEPFLNGSTAMLCNYFAFFPTIQEKMGEKAGFAAVPGKNGKRVASLGGQGFSISTKIAPERQALAKEFIAWFLARENQEKWITKPAGFTANTEILASAAFRAQTPYNGPFADSIATMQDFWNVPVFNELLNVTQKYLGKALDGEMATQDALDQLAAEKERILEEAGLLK